MIRLSAVQCCLACLLLLSLVAPSFSQDDFETVPQTATRLAEMPESSQETQTSSEFGADKTQPAFTTFKTTVEEVELVTSDQNVTTDSAVSTPQVQHSTPAYSFASEPQEHTKIEDESVEFICIVDNLESWQGVSWLNGSNIISMDDKLKIPPGKVSLVVAENTYKLQISNLEVRDEGDYICQITGDPPVSQVNTLIVNIPAHVEIKPSGTNHVDAEEMDILMGDDLLLDCIGFGKPEPTIQWDKIGGDLPNVGGGLSKQRLEIKSIGKNATGVYQCTGTNGVEAPDTKIITINVRYPPEVKVSEDFIHTGPGQDVSITCSFSASPEVKVIWKHNESDINFDTRSNLVTVRDNHNALVDNWILRINGVQPQDMGEYQCLGGNNRGEAGSSVTLSALPLDLAITSELEGEFSDEYTLRWKVSSWPKMVEYQMQYKEDNDTVDQWWNSSIPVPLEQTNPDHSHEYTFKGLRPNTTYIVKLKARNMFGTTEWTEEFSFKTNHEGNSAPIETLPPVISTVSEESKEELSSPQEDIETTEHIPTTIAERELENGTSATSPFQMLLSVLLLLGCLLV